MFVHVVLFQGIPEIALVAEKELKPQINKQTKKYLEHIFISIPIHRLRIIDAYKYQYYYIIASAK